MQITIPDWILSDETRLIEKNTDTYANKILPEMGFEQILEESLGSEEEEKKYQIWVHQNSMMVFLKYQDSLIPGTRRIDEFDFVLFHQLGIDASQGQVDSIILNQGEKINALALKQSLPYYSDISVITANDVRVEYAQGLKFPSFAKAMHEISSHFNPMLFSEVPLELKKVFLSEKIPIHLHPHVMKSLDGKKKDEIGLKEIFDGKEGVELSSFLNFTDIHQELKKLSLLSGKSQWSLSDRIELRDFFDALRYVDSWEEYTDVFGYLLEEPVAGVDPLLLCALSLLDREALLSIPHMWKGFCESMPVDQLMKVMDQSISVKYEGDMMDLPFPLYAISQMAMKESGEQALSSFESLVKRVPLKPWENEYINVSGHLFDLMAVSLANSSHQNYYPLHGEEFLCSILEHLRENKMWSESQKIKIPNLKTLIHYVVKEIEDGKNRDLVESSKSVQYESLLNSSNDIRFNDPDIVRLIDDLCKSIGWERPPVLDYIERIELNKELTMKIIPAQLKKTITNRF